MTELEGKIIERASELLSSGECQRVVGWKKGEFFDQPSPATFSTVEELKDFVYNGFCGANLSKYLIEISKKDGVTATFLKPCDAYSFNQLLKEHRIKREKVRVIGVECNGKLDTYKVKNAGIDGITDAVYDGNEVKFSTIFGNADLEKSQLLLERCLSCKGKKFVVSDEEIIINQPQDVQNDRFSEVKKLEAMTEEQRFAFWKSELSKCIRCNACRNVCPACTCVKCVFDNNDSGISAKANDDSFEEQLFHIIRAFHVSGRCTDCGECSRVCPQRIPLHLLNRKFIKDIDSFYGEYKAGESADGKTPLTEFLKDDIEVVDAVNGGKE